MISFNWSVYDFKFNFSTFRETDFRREDNAMTGNDYVTLLANCKPLSESFLAVFDLENHSLSSDEMRLMKCFFGLRANKSYNQLKFLSSQANLTADQFYCLEEMYTEMMFRFVSGYNMQNGRKLAIMGRWLQWLDGKVNWKINPAWNFTFYHRHF